MSGQVAGTAKLLGGFCPRPSGVSFTCFLHVVGGEAGAAEAAGEGAHPCKGEHRGAQCEGEPSISAWDKERWFSESCERWTLDWGLCLLTCLVLPASFPHVLFIRNSSYLMSKSRGAQSRSVIYFLGLFMIGCLLADLAFSRSMCFFKPSSHS